MDKQTQARWDAWAKGIARGVFRSMFPDAKALADALAEPLKAQLKKRDDRIAELERRLADLETATTRDNGTEWPIPERTAA